MLESTNFTWNFGIAFANPWSGYDLNYALAAIYADSKPTFLSAFAETKSTAAPEFVNNLIHGGRLQRLSRLLVGTTKRQPNLYPQLILDSDQANFFGMLDIYGGKVIVRSFGTYGDRPARDDETYSRCPLFQLSENAFVGLFAAFPTETCAGGYSGKESCDARAVVALAALAVAEYHFKYDCFLSMSAWPNVRGRESEVPQGQFFRRIFASYSRKDIEIVKIIDSIVHALGIADLRWDLKVLRSGENWATRVLEEIDAADQFQLFWSENSKQSEAVEKEWEYALTLARERFIRPVYWSQPMPVPPDALGHLHFEYLGDPTKIDLSLS